MILIVFLAVDMVLANIPGPVPTEQAISNVEQDPVFLLHVKTRNINGTVVNGTYTYWKYSNDPARDFSCVNTLYNGFLHYLNPFHEYTTTTLFFAVEFLKTRPLSNGISQLIARLDIDLYVDVNPTTGQIYRVQEALSCA